MTHLGFVYSITWYSPYTDPPDGLPRTLAEVFIPTGPRDGAPPKPPALLTFPHPNGYWFASRALSTPVTPLDHNQLAQRRRNQLSKKMHSRYPLIADDMIQEALRRKPDYYAGHSDHEDERALVYEQEVAAVERFANNPYTILTPKRIEYESASDALSRCHFTLYWMSNYHPGRPSGETGWAEHLQCFFADPRKYGFLPPEHVTNPKELWAP